MGKTTKFQRTRSDSDSSDSGSDSSSNVSSRPRKPRHETVKHKSSVSQIRMLLKKNVLLKTRGSMLCCTVCEFLTPIIFIALMCLPRLLIDEVIIEEQIHSEQWIGEMSTRSSMFFTPDNDITQGLLGSISNKVGFDTESEMVAAAQTRIDNYNSSPNNPFFQPPPYGVVFNSIDGNVVDYTLRGHYERMPSTFSVERDYIKWDQRDQAWESQALIQVQSSIERSFIESLTGRTLDNIDLRISQFPKPELVSNIAGLVVSVFMGIIIVVGNSCPMSQTIKTIVFERETKVLEGMKIMGLKPWLYWLSWLITSSVPQILATVAITAIGTYVWQYSSSLYIFVFFFLSSINMVVFSFFISTLFGKAKYAALLSSILWIVSMLPGSIFSDPNGDASAKMAACILPASAITQFTNILGTFEENRIGLTSESVTTNVAGSGTWNYEMLILIVAIDILLYSFLTFYLDNVIPREVGGHRPPWFLFQLSYWNPKVTDLPEDQVGLTKDPETGDNPNFEPVSRDLKATVVVKNLRRVFKTRAGPKVAVDKLSFNMYDGQITALLGHNGAGKTTTISMLTGMTSPTSGSAHILGYDIHTSMKAVRKNLGVCPQHDILWPTLTVEEHLLLAAIFKGVTPENRGSDVEYWAEEVGLTDKFQAKSADLSGGMKRKLSMGMAFIGDPPVVFLDEPTSGMDPGSRRHTWNTLMRHKEGKTIILTTHFMDEADTLGDRIAIMSEGRLSCVGSSLFLKSRFGVGYHLTMVKSPTFDMGLVSDFVKQSVDGAKLSTDVGLEVSFTLPQNQSTAFPSFLRGLEQSLSAFGVQGYGISVTTLEEVFLRVGELVHGENLEDQKERTKSFRQESHSRLGDVDNDVSAACDDEAPKFLFMRQMKALVYKRYLNSKRDKTSICTQLLVPAIFLCLALWAMQSSSNLEDYPSLQIKPDMYSQKTHVLHDDTTAGSDESQALTLMPMDIDRIQTSNTSVEWMLQTWNERAEDDYYVALLEANDNFQIRAYANSTVDHAYSMLVNQWSNGHLRQVTGDNTAEIQLTLYPWPGTDEERQEYAENASTDFQILFAVCMLLAFGCVTAYFSVFLVKERASTAKHVQFVSGTSVFTFWLATYTWDIINSMVPVGLTIAVLAAFDEPAYSNNLGPIFVYLLMFILSSLPLTYLLSTPYKEDAAAMSAIMGAYFLLGTLSSITVLVLDMIGTVEDERNIVLWVFRWFPHFGLGYGLLRLNTDYNAASTEEAKDAIDPFSNDIFGYNIMAMGIIIPVLWLLIALVENSHLLLKTKSSGGDDDRDLDEDVVAEQERVRRDDCDDILKAKSLVKQYRKGKRAVKGVSFGVNSGECFGLLGVNGAGKTTTFKMLTGEFPSTSGDCQYKGQSIAADVHSCRRLIGYCPQFGGLFPLLTGREHLKFYCGLKGMSSSQTEQRVNDAISTLGLKDHQHRLAGTYSGGNMRKLSVAIALVARPAVVLLDEPSTGMDPGARRKMWDVISSAVAKGKAVVLTTHSMEECEALATNLGIMVNGSFVCFGSVQHLKNKFGSGYSVEFRIGEDAKEAIRARMDTLKGSSLTDEHGSLLKYQVGSQHTSLPELFSLIEDLRQSVDIRDYAVSQTTLDEVFVNFAKETKHEDE